MRHSVTNSGLGISLLVLLLVLFLDCTNARFASTGVTVNLNDVAYYVPPVVVGTVPVSSALVKAVAAEGPGGGGLVPLTVVTTEKLVFGSSELETQITGFTAADDVFQDGFLETLYIQYTGSIAPSPRNPFRVDLSHSQLAADSTVLSGTPPKKENAIPNGPYFVTASGVIRPAYRLYADTQGSFTETTIESPAGTFSVLPANVPGQSLGVAVPSRLYYTASASKPLAGVRLGVKDIYDIAGLRTSNGNRAWYGLYGPANTTAVAVQRLVDAGAVVVGKMKTSQFANGETATDDWVDYHSPFNPRGDGYQDPSSSSSGPGAATGAYPWLDITLGSDTGGSIRGPSEVQGLFGNRPSHGMVPLTGVMPLSPELDTAGLLTRDPLLWRTAADALYGGLGPTWTRFPKSLLTVGFPTSADREADGVLLGFLDKLQKFLGANVNLFNINTAWTASRPKDAPASLTQLLNTTYAIMIAQDQVRLVRDPFYADYAKVNDGRRPAVDPVPLARWAFGESFPPEALQQAISNKTLFMNWFAGNVLMPDKATCSNSLMVYVGSAAGTNYRNTYRNAPSAPVGFSTSRISPMAEVPDMVVPIGQAEYNSAITMHAESLPVTVDFMAAKGCDGMIFSLVEQLMHAGIVSVSKPGRTLEDGGDILMRRDFW